MKRILDAAFKLSPTFILFCLITARSAASPDDIPLWERSWFSVPKGGYTSSNRFTMSSIKQEGLHLTGRCRYAQLEGQTPEIASIEGTDTGDGGFWPDVTTQVKDEKTGKWETVSEPFIHGHRKTITIKPGELRQDLFVTLDVLFPFVGKQKLGRVVLKTGEAAMFELHMLLERAPGEPGGPSE